MLSGNVLVTGGTGTLGQAIITRAEREGWPCRFTVFSRDPVRQQNMRRVHPRCRYVLGSVENARALYAVVPGHELVLHLAAQKHIPDAEANPAQCVSVNVDGSANVLHAAMDGGARQIMLISTDKACWPVNVYGATKFVAERMYQQAAAHWDLQVNICRYGNVLGSTGSVIPVWRAALARGERPKLTDPTMTRFWLTTDQAVDLILFALSEPSGTVTIPRLAALSMARLAEYVLPHGTKTETIGLRPGEKMHEMLVTPQEALYAQDVPGHDYIRLYPVTDTPITRADQVAYAHGYTSDRTPELTRADLLAMIGERPGEHAGEAAA